ncbi:MAG: diacylglycerol kinase [Pseudonocardiales bacterium]|nr:MAG: diacylglycerol kinase [Pseudonocardiales bacterium]
MTAVRRPAVVCNPASVEDIDLLAKQIRTRCSALGAADPLWYETTPEDLGAGQSRQALAAGADLVLACGGDGTVAACAGILAGTGVPLALVPVGTGNLLARNVAVPLDPEAALDVAFGPHRRHLDVLESADHRFVVMAGLGFDAALIRDTDDEVKARIGWPAYLAGAARAVRRTPPASYTITVDDGPALQRRALGVLVGNVGRLQAGLRVLPDAKPDDGVIDVGVLEPRRWRDWPVLALRILARRPDSGPQAEILRGRQVQISCDQEVPLEYDGDHVGQTRALRVHVLNEALVLCVPPS